MNPLWRVVRKLFGRPKGRHAAGALPPARPPSSPRIDEPPSRSVAARPAPPQSLAPVPPQLPVVPQQPVPPPLGLGRVRLIFGDGSTASLPKGSLEEDRARYLAENVLAATGHN